MRVASMALYNYRYPGNWYPVNIIEKIAKSKDKTDLEDGW